MSENVNRTPESADASSAATVFDQARLQVEAAFAAQDFDSAFASAQPVRPVACRLRETEHVYEDFLAEVEQEARLAAPAVSTVPVAPAASTVPVASYQPAVHPAQRQDSTRARASAPPLRAAASAARPQAQAYPSAGRPTRRPSKPAAPSPEKKTVSTAFAGAVLLFALATALGFCSPSSDRPGASGGGSLFTGDDRSIDRFSDDVSNGTFDEAPSTGSSYSDGFSNGASFGGAIVPVHCSGPTRAIVGDGEHKGLPSGFYIVESAPERTAYFATTQLGGPSGSIEDIANADFFTGFSLAKLKEGQTLTFYDAVAYPVELYEPPVSTDGTYRNGIYLVGRDMPPGDYSIVPLKDEYEDYLHEYAVFSGFDRSFESLLAQGSAEGSPTVSLTEGQALQLRFSEARFAGRSA